MSLDHVPTETMFFRHIYVCFFSGTRQLGQCKVGSQWSPMIQLLPSSLPFSSPTEPRTSVWVCQRNGAYTSQPLDNYCLPRLVRKMWLLTELLCRRQSLETCTRRLLLHTAALPFDVWNILRNLIETLTQNLACLIFALAPLDLGSP